MKNFRKNMKGFAHHALLGVVVVAVIALAGVKVLTGTHALTPEPDSSTDAQTSATVVKTYKETADGKLYVQNGAKKITDTSNNVTVIRLSTTPSSTGKPQIALWGEGNILLSSYYKGYKARICADVRYPFADGTIAISDPSSTGFWNRDVKKSVDNAFSFRCSEYEPIKQDVTQKAYYKIIQPAVYSWSKTAYVRDIKVEIAK